MGLLTTDFKYDAVRTAFAVSGDVDLAKLNRSLSEMRAGLVGRFEADRIPLADVTFERSGDLRYVGQGYELRVAMPDGEITEANLPQLWNAFHAAHAAEYGHAFKANPIEVVNVRLSGVGRVPKLPRPAAPAGGSLEKARVRISPCVFRIGGKLQSFDTTFYHRQDLPVGETFVGPAIFLQRDSTTLVTPGATARVDPAGNIIITLGAVQ